MSAVLEADALQRGASLEDLRRLQDELARGAPALERLMADGIAGVFPAEVPELEDWKELREKVQELRLKLRNRSNQRKARSAAPSRELGRCSRKSCELGRGA